METSNDRLRKAREAAGYRTAVAACEAFGWKESAYRHHENGSQGREVPKNMAPVYARAFGVRPEWLLWNDGPMVDDRVAENIQVIGYAGARERVNLVESDEPTILDEVYPLRAEDGFRAVIVKGESMLPAYRDGDVLFFRQDGVGVDRNIGRDCVVITDHERVYVKRIMKGSAAGLYNLLSYAPGIDPITDVKVKSAWPIEWIRRK